MTEAYNNSVCEFFFYEKLSCHVSSLGIGIVHIYHTNGKKLNNICLGDMSEKNFFLPSYIMYIGWLEYKCLFDPFIPIDILLFLTHRGLKEPICLTILNTEAWFGRRFGLRVVGRQSTDCRRLIKTTLDLDTRSGDNWPTSKLSRRQS